jgi:hypothetical protein
MVMTGHARRLAQPLSRAQRRAVGLVVVVILGTVLWAALRSGGAPRSAAGCVNLVMASSTGGGVLHDCGAAARRLCRSQATATGAFAVDVRAQCRLAGVAPR